MAVVPGKYKVNLLVLRVDLFYYAVFVCYKYRGCRFAVVAGKQYC